MPRPPRPTSIAIGLAAAAVLAPLLAGCELGSPTGGKPAGSAAPVLRVEVVHPERQTVRWAVGEPGQLQAFESTPLHAKVSGYVKGWTVNIGDRVKRGQVLAELSVPEIEAERKQKQAGIEQAVARQKQAEVAVKVAEAHVTAAEAKLAEAKAGVARAEADSARWRAEYQRVGQLFHDRAQTGSLLDETQNKLRSAEATVEEVRAQVRTAEVGVVQSRAELDQARSDVAAAVANVDLARADAGRVEALYGYARIVAPFDGVVTRRHVDTGDLTKPGADADPLFVLERSDIITIAVDVPELYAPEVGPGDRAEVKVQAIKGGAVEGKVTRTAWALDSRTRTLRVEIDVPNPEAKLRPGLYAYATIVAEEHHDALTLPASAVFQEKDASFCVVVARGKAARRRLDVGLSEGSRVEVVSGIGPGDAVVRANAAAIADGQPVEVAEPANPAAPGAKK